MNNLTDFSPRRVFTTPAPLPHTHTPHTSSGGYVLTQDPDGDDYVTVFDNNLTDGMSGGITLAVDDRGAVHVDIELASRSDDATREDVEAWLAVLDGLRKDLAAAYTWVTETKALAMEQGGTRDGLLDWDYWPGQRRDDPVVYGK